MFDVIVITAANASQAKGYRAMTRALAGKLAPRIEVVPDPGGRRVGSLGSTVWVLRKLFGKAAAAERSRVLICHSGGDSKRLPAYAASGKAFVPMPDGRSLFEHIVDVMDALPERAGVTVCCGDVIPRLDARTVRFARRGVTGVAYADGPWQARRHGVYQADARGRVTGFLQKPDVTRGRFLIDTGILAFDWETAERMKALPVAGDIYEEFPKLLLEGFAPFAVSVVAACEFFHIGSSRELLTLLGTDGRHVRACNAPVLALAGENIVTNVPAAHVPVKLGRGECLTCLPVGAEEWVDLRYRVDDDFKRDGTWERLKLGELMARVNHARLLALADEAVVEKPLRIDLAGGWSDTPPICNERGGCVLNAAVTLNGTLPAQARVWRVPGRVVRVESLDLGRCGELRTREEIYGPKDPHDWLALVKSALAVTGYSFARGGLGISLRADVPKGSGLGTSSILGAALIEALLKIRGERADWQRVSDLTLKLEREMRTGGGWQDQMGALAGGVKLVTSAPGAEQKLRVTRLGAAATARFTAFLRARALLYFTGQKRLARDVLRGVLDFYARNPDGRAHAIVRELKAGARAAFAALRAGDTAAFCRAVNGYWAAKKALDPGSTNEFVDGIIARVKDDAAAVTLCGAGGGGFMLIVAKSAAAKRRVRAALESDPPSPESAFYDMELWEA